MIAPILEEIAAEEEAIKIAKVNVDDSPDLARRYEIMSIPALIVLKMANPQKNSLAKPKGALFEEIGEFLIDPSFIRPFGVGAQGTMSGIYKPG